MFRKIKKIFMIMNFECYRYMAAGLFKNDSKNEFHLKIKSSKDVDFSYKNNDYFYRKLLENNQYVLGIFGKKRKVVLHNKQLQEEEREDYISCYVVFNTNQEHNIDTHAQTIFMESKKLSSDNLNILNEFIRSVPDLSINPINEESIFWEKIKNNITKRLTLEICPSNLFGHKNSMVQDSDNARDIYKAKRYKQIIETDHRDGLNLSNPTKEFKECVDYCMAGGGSVIATGEDGKKPHYNSKSKMTLTHKEITIEDSDTIDHSKIIKEFLK